VPAACAPSGDSACCGGKSDLGGVKLC